MLQHSSRVMLQELVRIALGRTGGDRQRAEDAVQAALLWAYEAGNYEKCRAKMLTWVMEAVKSTLSTTDARQRVGTDPAVIAEFGQGTIVPGTFRTHNSGARPEN